MIEGFLRNCESQPQKEALIINDEKFTYQQLLDHSLGLCSKLQQTEKGEKDILIGIYTDHSVNCYVSLTAVLMNGSAFLPLNRKFPNERLVSIIESSGIKKVFCREADKAQLGEIIKLLPKSQTIQVITNEFDAIKSAARKFNLTSVNKDQLAYLLFTSGSTGVPKGIGISNGNFRSFIEGMVNDGRYNFLDTDRFLQIFELSFDVSIACIFIAWEKGACLVPVPTENIVFIEALNIIKKYKVTVVSMAPSAVSYMKQLRLLDEFDFPFVRYTFLTGEALPHSLALAWNNAAKNSVIENAYGPTEVTVWSFMYRWSAESSLEEAVNGLVPIGKPLKNVGYKIVNEQFEPLGIGEFGQLLLSGSQVANGYWKNEKQTATTFIENNTQFDTPGRWYLTGDVVIKNQKENVVYINRLDNQVQINGFRVEIGEVEYRLRVFTKTDSVAVIPLVGEDQNISLVAYIEKVEVSAKDIKSYLATVLPVYMIPKKFYFLDSMPLNNSGKIDRSKLKTMANA